MKLTLKNSQIYPKQLNKQKKIIIDRLYKQYKQPYNPEENLESKKIWKAQYGNISKEIQKTDNVKYSLHLNLQKKTSTQQLIMGNLISKQRKNKMGLGLADNKSSDKNQEQSLLLSQQKCFVSELKTQQSSKAFYQSKEIFNNNNEMGIFQNFKVGYKPVSKPSDIKKVQRSLLWQLNQLRNKMESKKELLRQTANFKIQQLQSQKSDLYNLVTFKFSSKDECKNSKRESFFNKFNISTNQSETNDCFEKEEQQQRYPYYHEGISKAGKSRTQSIFGIKCNQQENSSVRYLDRYDVERKDKDSQLINNYQPNNRHLRLISRVQTERSSQNYSRPIGSIRRQNSHHNLQRNLQHQKVKQVANSCQDRFNKQSNERLRQIRQQLHQIYNNHRLNTNNNNYMTKIASSESQNEFSKKDTLPYQSRRKIEISKDTKYNKNPGREGHTGYLGREMHFKNQATTHNYKLLLQKSRNQIKI